MKDGEALKIFAMKVLWKVYGPVQNNDGTWRGPMNFRLNNLIKGTITKICQDSKMSIADAL